MENLISESLNSLRKISETRIPNRVGIYRELDLTRYELDLVYKMALNSHELLSSSGFGLLFDILYEKWMKLRAATGDSFAIKLGY